MTEKDQVLGMFFESVLRRISAAHGQPAADEVRAKIVGKKKLIGFFKYPVQDLLRAMQAGAALGPKDGFAATMEAFGFAAVDDFLASPVGKTLSSLAGTNVHRVISSAPPSYKACASYGDCRYEKLGDTRAQLTYSGELLGPSAQLGVVRATLKSTCRIEPKVEVRISDLPATAFTIDIQW